MGFGLAGLATEADNPRGPEIVAHVHGLFQTHVVPAFATGGFAGGYPVEGYPYGSNHFQRLLSYMLAVETATGADVIAKQRLSAEDRAQPAVQPEAEQLAGERRSRMCRRPHRSPAGLVADRVVVPARRHRRRPVDAASLSEPERRAARRPGGRSRSCGFSSTIARGPPQTIA